MTRPRKPTVELVHGADAPSGYGTLVRQIRKGLEQNGASVTDHQNAPLLDYMPYNPRSRALIETPRGPRYVDAQTGGMIRFGSRPRQWVFDHPLEDWSGGVEFAEPVTRDATRLVVGLPQGARYEGASRRLIFTMWESSELPKTARPWAPHLRRATETLVPAQHSATVIHDAAPDVATHIVPLALNGEDWPLVSRRSHEGRPFVFVMVGDLSVRKGISIAYDAFWRAFKGRSDVRLVFKTRGGSDFNRIQRLPRYTTPTDPNGQLLDDGRHWVRDRIRFYLNCHDDNVRVLRGDWTRAALAKLYTRADCFLWPSLGEGWGYPPREAAATGLPVITCAHTGMTDAGEWAYTVPFAENAVPALFNHWGGQCGFFPRPDVDALAERMAWMVEHRREAREFGEASSSVVTRRRTIELGADILARVAA